MSNKIKIWKNSINKQYSKVYFIIILHILSYGLVTTQNQIVPHGQAPPRCPEQCVCIDSTVHCMFLHLQRVPDVSPNTTVLDLRFNRIRSIKPKIFAHLKNLETLLLNNNHLTELRNESFDGLKNLKYLYLYKNRIRHIHPNTFANMEELEHLYLHFNKLESIDADIFQHLKNLKRLFLHKNRIKTIPAGTFRNLNSLKRLRLDSNALVCDCQLFWLAMMTKNNSKTQIAATCFAPLELNGKRLSQLTETEFHCKGMPQITSDPSDVEVNFGGTAYFTCKVDGDPQPEVVWLHNNEVIKDHPRMSVLGNGSTLMIENAQSTDTGFYICKAENAMGEVQSRKAKILMNDEPLIEGPVLESRPRFVSAPKDTNVTSGAAVKLPCLAEGHPPPRITWFKNNEAIEETIDVKVNPEGHLTLSDIRVKTAGDYKCEASNKLGTVSASARLHVIVLPRFRLRPLDVYTPEGGTAVFSCEAEGNPAPSLLWYKNGAEIHNSRRFNVLIAGKRLRIQDAKRYDEGEYVCQARNSAGTVETAASLFVRNKLSPVIKGEPRDVTTTSGSRVEMPCQAKGLPLPSIEWKKDGRTLVNSRKLRVGIDGTLLLLNVSSEDVGIYECTATNYIGYATARATLRIQEERREHLGDRYLEKSFIEAENHVNKAFNNTISKLFESTRTEGPNPHELLRVFRFPRYEGRNIAKISETIERTLEIVQTHVESGMKFNLTDFSYDDLLSPRKLRVLADLSGCTVHRRPVTTCEDMCFHMKYRTLDGSCNNLKQPMWGTSLIGFRRELPPIYENGFNTPVGWSKTKKYFGFFKPSARTVSTRLLSTEAISADHHCTHMLMQWGQFIDHDIDHALPAISTESFSTGEPCHSSCTYSAPCFPIKIPTDDPRVRHRCMEFTRSSAICGSGSTSVVFEKINPREQINQLTSFIDGSHIYSSSEFELRGLRNLTYPFGELRRGISSSANKPYLPFSNGSPIDCRRNFSESPIDCFLAGDVRANEQVGLLAMHTLWFRQHNQIAQGLRRINPHWDGDTIFHESRKIVGAMIQHITYTQWLPHILGPAGMKKLGEYKGYNPQINPTISNVFATAAFRFGHTLINPIMHRLNSTFQTIPEGHLPLHKAFFSPWRIVEEGGIDPILRGMFVTPAKAKKPNQLMNSELTENLFPAAHDIALDLAAINIQRGRDHALPGYTEWRKFCNLPVPETFEDLKSDISTKEVRSKLRQIYGHPGNMDLFVGALLEEAVEGGRVGPTVLCLLAKQFRDLRDGDRFWYENPSVFKAEQLTQIKQVTLGSVMCENGDDFDDVTLDAFVLPQEQSPTFVKCSDVPSIDLRMWSDCCRDCREEGSFSSLTSSPLSRFRRDTGTFRDSNDYQSYSNNEIIFPKNYPPKIKFSQNLDSEKEEDLDVVYDTPEMMDYNATTTPSPESVNKSQDGLETENKELEKDNGIEDRIEGLESLVHLLLSNIEELNQKIKKLESLAELKDFRKFRRKERKRLKHGCKDVMGIQRQKGEKWRKGKCYRCVCWGNDRGICRALASCLEKEKSKERRKKTIQKIF